MEVNDIEGGEGAVDGKDMSISEQFMLEYHLTPLFLCVTTYQTQSQQ
jgi:hypothetical protein